MVFFQQIKDQDTVNWRTHLKRTKAQIRYYNCEDKNLGKDCPKPRKIKRKTSQYLDQNSDMTFSMNMEIPIEMLQDINRQQKKTKTEE